MAHGQSALHQELRVDMHEYIMRRKSIINTDEWSTIIRMHVYKHETWSRLTGSTRLGPTLLWLSNCTRREGGGRERIKFRFKA